MAPWALELLAYGLLYECLPRDKAAAARLELRPSDREQRLYGGSEDSDGAEHGASGQWLSWGQSDASRHSLPMVCCQPSCAS